MTELKKVPILQFFLFLLYLFARSIKACGYRQERKVAREGVPYTIGAQQPFRLTGTRVGVKLGTKMEEGYQLWHIDGTTPAFAW
jgi:hypothetical protein